MGAGNCWEWMLGSGFDQSTDGHRDMKTTERYIRAHRLTRYVALVEKNVHKLATNEIRPPVLAALSS